MPGSPCRFISSSTSLSIAGNAASSFLRRSGSGNANPGASPTVIAGNVVTAGVAVGSAPPDATAGAARGDGTVGEALEHATNHNATTTRFRMPASIRLHARCMAAPAAIVQDSAVTVAPPILETERVRLRPFCAEDRDGVFALFSDPLVTRYWSFTAWTTLAQADEFLAAKLAPQSPDTPTTYLPWVLADRATDAVLGTVTIFELRLDQRRAEIGYSLRSAHWGQGLAREAVTRVLAYGFDDLSLRRFEADIDPRNTASIALVERLGFQREGTLRERWMVAGEPCDTALFGLLAHEFHR